MTIDGFDISIFGLILTKFTGNFDLPARKKVLSEPEFDAGDQTLQEKKYYVNLFGQYASQNDLATNVDDLRDLLKNTLEHDFVIPTRGYTFKGVVKNGFKTKVFRNDVQINFVISVV